MIMGLELSNEPAIFTTGEYRDKDYVGQVSPILEEIWWGFTHSDHMEPKFVIDASSVFNMQLDLRL